MRFDRNLYAEAWRVLCALWPYVLVAVVGEFTVDALTPVTRAYLGENIDLIITLSALLVWTLMLYKAHAEVLGPDQRKMRVKPIRFLGFFVRLFGVEVTSLLIFFALVFLLFGAATGTLGDLGSFETADPDAPDILGMGSFISSLLLFGLAAVGMSLPFFLYGTVLPAYVANAGRGVGRAFRRGRRQFTWFAPRLVLGPGVMALCTVALYKLPPSWVDAEADVAVAYDFSNPVLPVTTFIGVSTQAYMEIMLAALLSRVFLRDEAATGEPDRDEESPTTPVSAG